ncbi:MAG: ABC transporter permease [Pseudomonadota bacterium]|nr:ABC transporter permease [Pseudomonadota bacterium]
MNTLLLSFFNLLKKTGDLIFSFFHTIGEIIEFFLDCVKFSITEKFYFQIFLKQFVKIGFNSLPVVGLTSIFTGMVLALQSYTGFSRFSAESAIPNVVVLSITRELAPVLAGLMVAGRSGAAIAAEIGTMKVTEQIDALKTLSTNPYNYLIIPRILAGIISLPMLVFIGDIIGVLGGYLICTGLLNFNPTVYLQNTFNFVQFIDVFSGLVKASVFGFLITFMGCYHGFNAKGGAQGVGQSTTYSVVSSSILILLMNYIITSFFFKL